MPKVQSIAIDRNGRHILSIICCIVLIKQQNDGSFSLASQQEHVFEQHSIQKDNHL